MKKFLLSCATLLFLLSPAQAQKPSNNEPQITYKIIPAQNNTWGYEIYIDGARKIHQLTIPGVAGNSGFSTKEKCRKVAELVIGKIKKGQMPPTVTEEELKQLNAL